MCVMLINLFILISNAFDCSCVVFQANLMMWCLVMTPLRITRSVSSLLFTISTG